MRKQNVDILLFVEHVARELDIACAVKYLVNEQHKLSLAVASIASGLSRTLHQYNPRVVAIPYCYFADDFGLRDILSAWPNAVYVNLAYEQVYQKINLASKAPKDNFAREYVLHHAWGQFYAHYLQEHGVPEKNIVINGNPSYSLYCPLYAPYFESRVDLGRKHQLDMDIPWVFVPENYGVAFYTDDKLQDYIRRGYSESEAYQYREFAQDSFWEAVQWWGHAAKLGTMEVIVRPRPATPRVRFVKACQRILGGKTPKNLHIIKHGTVREWILASNIITSSYSTTLIEASIASKPIYMLQPFPFPDLLHADWYELVPQVTNLSQFMEAVTNPTLEATWKPLQTWATQVMMGQGDAISNLANLLASVYRGEQHTPGPPDVALLPAYIPRRPIVLKGEWRWLRQSWRALNTTLRTARGQPPNWHEQDSFYASDVAWRLSKWAQALEQVPPA